jgi:lipid-binding SYLF domain-containing protein
MLVLAFSMMLAASSASAQYEQRHLVTQATITLAEFLSDPDLEWLKDNFSRAQAVLIAPHVTKAGLILGGSGGRAVVVARNPKTGKWSDPAFYTLATASIGVQAGVSVSQVLTLVMTEKGLHTLLGNSVKLGGDVAVAAGPIGAGAQSNLQSDFVSFSRSTGVYGGLNFDGTVITASDKWNRAYYGKHVTATDILVRMAVRSRQARELLNLVTRASK